MGYTTSFKGRFDLDKTLAPEHAARLREFAAGDHGTEKRGRYCQWVPSDDGNGIEWDGEEKFYEYVEWINEINDTFLKPWGYVLSGTVKYSGEEADDNGRITIENGVAVKHEN